MGHGTPLPLLRPMLPVSARPFDSESHYFEVKWDGYRAMAYLSYGETRLRSRNLLDISPVFPELGDIHRRVDCLPALLDGELVVFQKGIPSFASIQARGRLSDQVKIRRISSVMPAVYIVFDILYASGKSVMGERLSVRKEILASSVNGNRHLALSEFITGSGLLFAGAARDRGLEGIMAKSVDSAYLPGKRSPAWKKIRFTRETDLVIFGFTRGKGAGKLGSLLLCGFSGDRAVYAGRVGTGFSRETGDDLIEKLNAIRTVNPVVKLPQGEAAGAIWVRPELVCTVEYLERTGDGRLRHPSFKGLRFDKGPAECNIMNTE
ncbi:MAG: non-homologous end-joining DNA ligase [Bacillota bacterium]